MPSRFVDGVYPKLLSGGLGAEVLSPDKDAWYIDMIAGLGAISLGYSNLQVNGAVRRQLEQGVSFSLPNKLEADVAEALCRLIPFTDMWKYGKNGTDATLMAVRAARAITGRPRILISGYHGCSDHFEVFGARQAGMVDLSWYTYRLTDDQYPDKVDFACLITEPDTCDLKKAREWCDRTGALLIVDEVITGGRTEKFTQCALQGITPDFITVGKGLANGFPLSAVGGKRSLMNVFERDDFFASMTFGGECVSLAAAMATLPLLEEKIPGMVRNGSFLQHDFNLLFGPHASCASYPTRLIFKWPSVEHKALFMQTMCENGVLTGYSNFIMGDYTAKDMARLRTALCCTSKVMLGNWDNPKDLLKGPTPSEVIRR